MKLAIAHAIVTVKLVNSTCERNADACERHMRSTLVALPGA